MEYNLEYWNKYISADSAKRFDVDKNMLKVLLVNQNSDDAFFNYFNFDNRQEIISFLKFVVLPTTILSKSFSEYEEILQLTLDYEQFIELIKTIEEVDDKDIEIYEKLYTKLDNLSKTEITIKNLVEITEEMNYIFSSENDVFLIVEFSDCLETYLKDIYIGYKKVDDDFETLKQRFLETDFTLVDFVELMNDTKSMQQDDLEEFLYQIPII